MVLLLCLVCTSICNSQATLPISQEKLNIALKLLDQQNLETINVCVASLKDHLTTKKESFFEWNIPGLATGIGLGVGTYIAVVCCIACTLFSLKCCKYSRKKIKNRIKQYMQKQKRKNAEKENDWEDVD